jgi:hypothetical protein
LAYDKSKGIAVEPFVGRGADLSRAIVRVLETKQPQTTRQISKAVTSFPDQKNTTGSTVNKKVRDLEKKGYLQKVQVNQRVGGITNYYQLTPNLELSAYLDTHTGGELFTGINREDAATLLANIKKAQESKKST